jgi:lipopolysaccharide biosynthesis glycosyltransferase
VADPARPAAIVLALNDRFVPPAQVTLESIRQYGGRLDGVSLVVITAGLTTASVDALHASAAAARLPLAIKTVHDTSELGDIAAWAQSTCLRLYMGDLAQEFARALYLDSDMLVLSALAPLIDVDLHGRTAAAVINYPPMDVVRIAIPRSRRGTVDGDAPYFNAGVLLVDPARWAQLSVGQRSRAFLRQFPTTRLFDQDALNIALIDDWHALEKEWNTPAGPIDMAPIFGGLAALHRGMSDTMREWQVAQARPRILHFTGHPKPWESDYPWTELQQQFTALMRPEFGSAWPSSEAATVDVNGQQHTRDFRRI